MSDPSSFVNPTPLAHADASRDVLPRGDGSSIETFSNGASGVFMTTPSDGTYQQVFGAGAIASCFTCEPRAIIEALDLYETLPILEQVKGLVIFCDSKAVLWAILYGKRLLS
ncbi:hypothetical protein TNCV_1426421 [Trichonephila clavipes]|nr:hypothetical protein TNCV_1426421 [Trichonephila clavipes]